MDKAPRAEQCHVYKRRAIHVARMDMMKPNADELWCLEQILTHISGRSHQDFRAVDGNTYDTFSGAASKLVLLNENSESHLRMKEAVDTLCDLGQRRSLFTLLASKGAPAPQPFNEYKKEMEENYRCELSMSNRDAENACQHDLASRIEGINI